jgi:hypothetical protein
MALPKEKPGLTLAGLAGFGEGFMDSDYTHPAKEDQR